MVSKEQWRLIKDELSGTFGAIDFMMGDIKLSIYKTQISDTKLGYQVFIDEKINLAWGYSSEELFNPITETVWDKKTIPLYKPARKKEIIKALGIREARKSFDVDKEAIYYNPYFTSYNVFERKYKKIKNLELIEK